MTSERSSHSASSSSVITISLAGASPAGHTDLWYDGDQISRLLHQVVGHRTDTEIFAPINIEQSDTLRINLQDEQIQQALRISKGEALASTYLFPINLGNRHWAALYLNFPTNNRFKPHVSYFDPYGTPTIPAELMQALSTIYTDLKAEDFLACPLQLQRDAYNCGPWVVAIFESLITTGRFPDEGFNIQRKREEYALILQGKPKIREGVGEQKEEQKEQKRTSQPSLLAQAAKDKAAAPEKTLVTLAEQQLAALSKEALGFEAKTGYENQIKAAFYYQVALAFCDKKLMALAEISKTEAKKLQTQENKREATPSFISGLTPTPSKDWIAFYTAEKEKIIQALATLESIYPEKALGLLAKKTQSSTFSLSESKVASAPLLSHELLVKRLMVNSYKLELQRIRTKAASLLESYKKQSMVVTSETKAESKSILTMQGIYRELTADMKQLIRQMIANCIEEYSPVLGYPPCDYAFFGLGSMARDEMTPYSDLEFGILIAEDDQSGINKTYFQHITQLLHLRIINLGETIPRIMGVELPKIKIPTGTKIEHDEIPNPVPNGLSFDGVGAGGCKNPLGRKDKFELIGTPEALADYQDQRHYEEKGNLQDERFLPSSLAHVTLIAGGKAKEKLVVKLLDECEAKSENILLQEYHDEVDRQLRKPIRQLWGKPIKLILRQTRALELLLSDIERFRPKMGKIESTGRSYSVKHDLYRLPNTVLDQLALFYALPNINSWACVDALSTQPALFTSAARKYLLQTLDQINEYRLAAYLHLEEQCEEAEVIEAPTDKASTLQVFSSGIGKHAKAFPMSMKAVHRIYYSLLPFWQAARRFRDRLGDGKAFQEIFPDLYSDSPFIQGQITALLKGYRQALEIFTPLLPKVSAASPKEETKTEEAKTDAKATFSLEQGLALQATGRAYQEEADYDKAETHLRQAIRAFEAYGPSYAVELSECYLDLALALKAQGSTKEQEAKTCVEKASTLVKSSYGAGHPYATRCEQVRLYIEQPAHSLLSIKSPEMKESWNLPRSNETLFVGRVDLLTKLRHRFNALEASQRVVLSAVSGLGGIGKTSLAIYYLHHVEHPYRLKLWFRAESEALLQTDYLEFARQFHLIPLEEKNAPKDVCFAVKRFLEKHADWLAVYDNAGDYKELRDYLPDRGGHLIITTRKPEWHAVGLELKVNVFTPEEACEYLKKAIGPRNIDETAAMQALAAELGYLPLALAQAGAYMNRRGKTAADYLALYQRSKAELLADKLLPADSNSAPVTTTWQISLDAIAQEEKAQSEQPVSLLLLQAMAYLHAEHIPRSLLARWLQETQEITDMATEGVLDKALGRLRDYSLIHLHVEAKTISLHCLVQEVVRFQLQQIKSTISTPTSLKSKGDTKSTVSSEQSLHAFLLTTLVDTSLEEFNLKTQVLVDEKRQKALLPHLQVLVKHHDASSSVSILSLDLVRLLEAIGNVLAKKLGDDGQAKLYHERALKIVEQLYDKDHWHVASALNNLANTYKSLGDAQTSQTLLERALKIKEQHHGKDHWEVAGTLNNLANAYEALGDAQTQKMLLERALKIQEQHYGKDHWQVGGMLGNLANAYGSLGDTQTQKMLLERALKIDEQHYGKDHSEVAITLGNLAAACIELGDAQMAKTLLERALKMQEQHYGKDYWQVANTLNNLAVACGELGDTQTKKTLLERALKIVEQYYGKDHVQVAVILDNLGSTYGVLGDLQAKKTLLKRALMIKEQYYDKDHQQVAITLNNLANAYRALGDAQMAKTLLERALKIQEQYYGQEHWQVGRTLGNLANAYGDLEDAQTQKTLLERALNIVEQHYGKDHWQVVGTLNNLAIAYGKLGDVPTAKTLLERVLKINEQHYGKDYWQVAMTLGNLGNIYIRLGDISMALKYAHQAYRIFTASFENPDHPYIKTAETTLKVLQEFQQQSTEEKQTLETKNPSTEHKTTTTTTEAKTDTIIMALEERSLDYVQRLQQVVGTIPSGTPIVQYGKKSLDSHWVSFSTFWLKQLPPKAIDELSKELHVSKEQFQHKIP